MGRKDRARELAHSSPGDSLDTSGLAELLDQALAQLNSGDDPQEILARYPAHAGVLQPMLRAAASVRHTSPPLPDAAARQAGLDRLLNAVSQLREAALDAALDDAVVRLRAGETPAAILGDHPAIADDLRPLLEVAAFIIASPQPAPDPERRLAGRERLLEVAADRHTARTASQPAPAGGLFEDALDNALRWVADGIDMDTALSRHPIFAARMRPLLEIAQEVRQVPDPVPDEDAYFAGRKRVVQLADRRRRQRQAVAAQRPALEVDGWADALARLLGFAPRLRRVAMTVALLLLMLLGSFSVTRVAADSLPTSPLYPVKRLGERVQLAMTSSPEAKVKLHLRFSQERLYETERLARESGRSDAGLLNDMLDHNDQILGYIKYLPEDQQRQLLADGAEVFYQQRRLLSDLSDADSPLAPSERLALRDYVGAAGNDQAIAEEVQRDLDLATYIPTPAPPRPAAATATAPIVYLASPTLTPTEVVERVKPTAKPATPVPPAPPAPTDTVAPTPVPPTPTDAPEVIMGSDPLQADTPTATTAPTATPEPTQVPTEPPPDEDDEPTSPPPPPPAATATSPPPPPPAATATSPPPPPPPPPTSEPEPTQELVMPTLPPPPQATP